MHNLLRNTEMIVHCIFFRHMPMKRFILLSAAITALTSAEADYKEGYYDDLDGTSRERLKEAAKRCVEQHTRLNYTDLPNYWAETDIYPDLEEGCRRFWDMYSDNIYLIADNQTGKQAFSANKMQREHLVPKSWWKKGDDVEYTPAYSDMWNLYPSDGPANQAKNNYPLSPVATATFDNGVSKVGTPEEGYGGGCKNAFEPADEYKGDFARAVFYMATVYDDLPWKYTYMLQTEGWPTLRPWAYEMLLDWARLDPVSEKETHRNDAVEECQGNRNPYIDFPQLAEYVWGTLDTEIFFIDDQPGGVVHPNGTSAPVFEINNGYIRIICDSSRPVRVADITGRILLLITTPHNGDTYELPEAGLLMVSDGIKTIKTIGR